MRFFAQNDSLADGPWPDAEPDTYRHAGWRTLACCVSVVLILFTVCGNAMTLFAVCKMKTFQNSISNLYIASLAAADLVVGAFVMTFMMLYTIAYEGHWLFGQLMCDVWQAADFISCTVSLYSICAIGFDRWLNLEKPLRVLKRNTVIARRALVAVWLLPLAVWTPLLVALRLRNGRTVAGSCTFDWRPPYLVPLVAVPFFYVPVLALMVLFVRISLVIRSHLAFLHQHSNQSLLLDLPNVTDRSFSALHTPSTHRRRPPSPLAQQPSPSPACKSRAAFLSPIPSVNVTCMLSPNAAAAPPPPGQPRRRPTLVDIRIGEQSVSSVVSPPAPPGDLDDDPDDADADARLLDPTAKIGSPLPSPNAGNQSPLAMKLLRERLNTRRCSLSAAKESTPLLGSYDGRAAAAAATSLDPPTPRGQKRSASRESVGACDDEPVSSSRRSASPQLHQQQQQQQQLHQQLGQHQKVDRKRSSVTSDTAVFFTKRFLSRKPPLLRAKTELALQTGNGVRPRPAGRFSIISMASPLFARKYSVNIFSDVLPYAGLSQQIRAAKAVGVIMFFFLLCWTPFLVLWPLKTYCERCVSDGVYQLAIWANYLNSTLNPVLYTLCSPRFQRVFRKHCACRWRAARGKQLGARLTR